MPVSSVMGHRLSCEELAALVLEPSFLSCALPAARNAGLHFAIAGATSPSHARSGLGLAVALHVSLPLAFCISKKVPFKRSRRAPQEGPAAVDGKHSDATRACSRVRRESGGRRRAIAGPVPPRPTRALSRGNRGFFVWRCGNTFGCGASRGQSNEEPPGGEHAHASAHRRRQATWRRRIWPDGHRPQSEQARHDDPWTTSHGSQCA